MDDVENQHPDGGIEDHDPDGVAAAAEPDEESTCGLLLFTTVTFLALSGSLVYVTTTLHGTRKAFMAGLAASFLLFAVCLCAGTVVRCITGNTDGDQQEEVELQHIEAPLE